MPFKNYFFTKTPILILGSLFIITSCGTYQNVPDNDGIYGSSEIPVEQEQVVSVNDNPSASNTYYKNYFKEKADEYDIYTQDEVFTDVDEYSSDYTEASDSTNVDYNQYAGWGQENSNVSINVYSGFNYGWGYPYGWGWNAGWGWGYPYSYWGWNAGWGYPYYGWGWNAGWGWGYPGYGWAYCPPYYGGGYYSPYYRNNLSYTYGRRGSMYLGSGRYAANNNAYMGRYNVGRRSNTTSHFSSGRPRSDYNSSGKPRVRSTNRPNENGSAVNSTGRPRTQATTKPRTRTRTNSTPRVRTNRPTTRSYNSTPSRSYSSPSRGSSSMGGGRSASGGGRRGGL